MYKFYSYVLKIDSLWLLNREISPFPAVGATFDIKMRQGAQILSVETKNDNEIIIRTVEDETEKEEIKKLIIKSENGSIPKDFYIHLKPIKTFSITKMQNVYKEGMSIPSSINVSTTYFLFELIDK